MKKLIKAKSRSKLSSKVFIRIRPLSSKEQRAPGRKVTRGFLLVKRHQIRVQNPVKKTHFSAYSRKRTYTFDNVFTGRDNTQTVYQKAVSPILDNLLSGFNATVFAYGMTGAGKTYTMFGSMTSSGFVNSQPGLVVFAVEDLFEKIERLSDENEFTLRLSYLEIYNEQVMDLLTAVVQDRHRQN